MLITPQTIHVFNNFEYTSSKIASINLNGYFEPDLRVKLIDVSPSDIPDNRSLLNKILVELIKTESSYKFIDLQDVIYSIVYIILIFNLILIYIKLISISRCTRYLSVAIN